MIIPVDSFVADPAAVDLRDFVGAFIPPEPQRLDLAVLKQRNDLDPLKYVFVNHNSSFVIRVGATWRWLTPQDLPLHKSIRVHAYKKHSRKDTKTQRNLYTFNFLKNYYNIFLW